MTLHKLIHKYYPFILTIGILLILCEWTVGQGWVPSFIIPKPSAVVHTLFDQFDFIWEQTKLTLTEVLLGLSISLIAGLGIGILLYYSDWARRALYPFILISQTIPTIALSPIFIMWFGYGMLTKVAVIFLFCFFPLVVSVYDGLRQTDHDYLHLFRNMQASQWQTFRHLEWKMALPSIYSGIKLAVIYALMGATVGEWLGGNGGLGYYIRRMSSSLKSEGVFAGIVVLSLIGISLFGLVSLIESRRLSYRYQKGNK